MPKLRYLRIRFSEPLFPYEVPQFRAALIEKTARASDLFHNHDGDTGFLYRYPLIQYKVTYKKASVICLGEGADAIHQLFEKEDLDLRVGSHYFKLAVEDVAPGYREVKTGATASHSALPHWPPLTQKHHRRWQQLEGDEGAQISLLQSILTGHLLAFASGIDWQAEERLQVRITRIREMKLLPYKGSRKLAVSLNFESNVSLPDFIGLGKGASVGFGIVKRINEHKTNMNHA